MVLKLEPTGERLDDSEPLGELELDGRGMLGVKYDTLKETVAQIVRAINVLTRQTRALESTSVEAQESLGALEQQLSLTEGRLRECEGACQEMRVEVGTLVAPAGAAESEEDSEASEAGLERLEQLAERLEQQERAVGEQHGRLREQLGDLDAWLQRLREAVETEVNPRLAGLDDASMALRAEMETLRTGRDQDRAKAASKVELNELATQVQHVSETQQSNECMLEDAKKNFAELDLLMKSVDENRHRMQEISRLFKEQYSELRAWASDGLQDLRQCVRTKIDERFVHTALEGIRAEMEELRPRVHEALTQAAANGRGKAEGAELTRIWDALEDLKPQDVKPGQLLMGTKCLACDRLTSKTDGFADDVRLSLERTRQQEQVFNDIERSLKRQHDRGHAGGEVLQYVSVHVGSPGRLPAGSTVVHTQDADAQGYSLLKASGLSRRPWTSPSEACARAARVPAARPAPREMPPLVRASPRKGEALRARGAPVSRSRVSLRATLGSARLPPSPEMPSALPDLLGSEASMDPLEAGSHSPTPDGPCRQ